MQKFVQSFFIGMAAASAVGPIFVLTFNRAAMCGFGAGVATALGAACADGFLFCLGLAGALALIKKVQHMMVAFELVGAIVLFILGYRSLTHRGSVERLGEMCRQSYRAAALRSFLLTIINPLTVFFFMAVGLHLIPDQPSMMSMLWVFLHGCCAAAGSGVLMVGVSTMAHYIGTVVDERMLRIIMAITGIVFCLVAGYLVIDVVSTQILRLLRP